MTFYDVRTPGLTMAVVQIEAQPFRCLFLVAFRRVPGLSAFWTERTIGIDQ